VSGAFACASEDEWVAIQANGPDAVERLTGGPLEGDLNDVVAAWAGRRSREEVIDACLAAGVACAPVHNEAEILGLEPLLASEFWQGQERAVVGYHQYPGLPVRWEGRRAEPERPAPTLGEHTDAILTALGVPPGELAALAADGVIGNVPPG
jgi:formyl-CoA transferase